MKNLMSITYFPVSCPHTTLQGGEGYIRLSAMTGSVYYNAPLPRSPMTVHGAGSKAASPCARAARRREGYFFFRYS